MTKRESFAALMELLGETFNRPLTSGLLDGYWMALEDLSAEDLKTAVKRAVVTSKFMPTPAELLALVRPQPNPAVDALKAWQVVRNAIDVHDYLVASIDFGTLVNAVIRNLGGWDTLCKATLPELDNPGWLRKRFEEIYRAFASTDESTLKGEPLEGALPRNYVNPKHVIVPIDGTTPRMRLEANGSGDARASIAAHIQHLADDKSEP